MSRPPASPPPRPTERHRAASAKRHTLQHTRVHRPVVRPGPGARSGGPAPDVDTWRTLLRDCIIELDATPVGPAPEADYTGWAYLLDLGQLTVTDVGSDPVRVARTPRAIGRSHDDFYHLSIARRASWSTHAGQEIRLRAGDAVLLDGTEPFSLTADGFAHHLVVNVPRGDLRRDLRVDRALLGRRIAAENPALRVLTAMITELGRDTSALSPGAHIELGHTAGELVVSTLRMEGSAGDRFADSRLSRNAQLLRMQDFVRRHLADPDLSPKTLAAAFEASVRYVEVVFREGGVSPSRYIRETRLAEARRMLADPRQRHRSIAAVGRSVGIDNASVFARTFRGRYEVTPREYRQATSAGA